MPSAGQEAPAPRPHSATGPTWSASWMTTSCARSLACSAGGGGGQGGGRRWSCERCTLCRCHACPLLHSGKPNQERRRLQWSQYGGVCPAGLRCSPRLGQQHWQGLSQQGLPSIGHAITSGRCLYHPGWGTAGRHHSGGHALSCELPTTRGVCGGLGAARLRLACCHPISLSSIRMPGCSLVTCTSPMSAVPGAARDQCRHPCRIRPRPPSGRRTATSGR